MIRRPTTRRNRRKPRDGRSRPAPPPRLSQAERRRLSEYAELGNAISTQDAVLLLSARGSDEAAVLAFLASTEGQRLWGTGRAEGRVGTLSAIRKRAFSGNSFSQKILAEQLASDDSRRIADQRLTGEELRGLLGRSKEAVAARVRTGDWLAAGHDKQYAVADVIGLIPRLWDRLQECRRTIAGLEAQTSQARTDKAEAQRLLALEQVRARKRENDVAEGRLVDAQAIKDQIIELAEAVRTHLAQMANEIKLKLSLPDHACVTVENAKRECLGRLARVMEGSR